MKKLTIKNFPVIKVQILISIIFTCFAIHLANSMNSGEGLGVGLRLMFSPFIALMFWIATLPVVIFVKFFIYVENDSLNLKHQFILIILGLISLLLAYFVAFYFVAPAYFKDTAEMCGIRRDPSKDFVNVLGQRLLYLNSVDQKTTGNNQYYWVAEVETTQKQYMKLMGANPSFFKGDDNPVENLTYSEALAFVDKLNALEKFNNQNLKGYKYYLQSRYECWCHYADAIRNPWLSSFVQQLPEITHNVNQGAANRLGIKGSADNVAEMHDYGESTEFGAGSFERPTKSSDEWWSLEYQFPDHKAKSVGFRIVLAHR